MTTTNAATKLSWSICRRQAARRYYLARPRESEFASKSTPITLRVPHSDTGQKPEGNCLAIMAVLVLFLPQRRLIYE